MLLCAFSEVIKIDWVIFPQLYLKCCSTKVFLKYFHHNIKISQRHNSTSTIIYYESHSKRSLNRKKKHYVEQKCSYFCVGCLSPNSLMLSCKESWRDFLVCGGGDGRVALSSPAARTITAHFPAAGEVTSAHPRSYSRPSRPQRRAFVCLLVSLSDCMWSSRSLSPMFFLPALFELCLGHGVIKYYP